MEAGMQSLIEAALQQGIWAAIRYNKLRKKKET